jgi:two-component system capsular synthesis sensor histidine kinase RcsC
VLSLFVRSPSRELADNLCDRLRLRGATAQTFTDELASHYPDDTPMLDVMPDGPTRSWPGPHVEARTDAGDHPEQIEGRWVVSMYNLGAIVEALLLATGAPATVQDRVPLTFQRSLGLQVLVAEDNPINQMILREQLEQLGCQAVVASDGDEALGYWAQRHFDVVLTDINMPHIDGYVLTRRLRDQGVKAPIIGATASASPEERDRCLAAGMDSCLVKPISLQALSAALSDATGNTVAEAVPASHAADAVAGTDGITVPAHLRSLFVGTMRTDLLGLVAAIDTDQSDQVRQMLHRIRGALVMVSAQPLVDDAQRIEDRIAAGAALDDCRDATQAFITQLERALVRIERAPAETPDVH